MIFPVFQFVCVSSLVLSLDRFLTSLCLHQTFPREEWKIKSNAIAYQPLTDARHRSPRDCGFMKANHTSKDQGKEGIACPWSQGSLTNSAAVPHFLGSSLCCCYACRNPLLPFMSLARLNSELTFLSPSLHTLKNYLCLSWGTCPCLHLLYTFLYSSFARSSLFVTGGPATFAWPPTKTDQQVLNLEEVILENWLTLQSSSPLLSRAVSHVILPRNSLNSQKYVLLKSRVVILSFPWLSPLRVPNFTIPWSQQSSLPPAFTSQPVLPCLWTQKSFEIKAQQISKPNLLQMETIAPSWLWRDSYSVWVWHRESAM